MKKYNARKYYSPGVYFITINTWQRAPILLEHEVLNAFRTSFSKTRVDYPFKTHAWVVMPDHMHFVIEVQHSNLARLIGRLKSETTRLLPEHLRSKAYGINNKFKWRRRRQVGKLWHNRFYQHRIVDHKDFQRCVKYCLYNPVKHGYAAFAYQWEYSTLHKYIEQGIYPEEWKYLQGQ